jgi:hypothetical protein
VKYLKIHCFIISLLLSLNAWATKPCHPNSYFANQERGVFQWIEESGWAMRVMVTKINDNWQPAFNCYAEDQDTCAQENRGSFDAIILEVLKGDIDTENIAFNQAYCSKGIPEKTGEYIFYGDIQNVYTGFARHHARCYPGTSEKINCQLHGEQPTKSR